MLARGIYLLSFDTLALDLRHRSPRNGFLSIERSQYCPRDRKYIMQKSPRFNLFIATSDVRGVWRGVVVPLGIYALL